MKVREREVEIGIFLEMFARRKKKRVRSRVEDCNEEKGGCDDGEVFQYGKVQVFSQI